MPGTIAWLRNLPSEHLELVRAVSISLPGDYNPATWLEFDAAVLSKSTKTNITLYYFQGDYRSSVLYKEYLYFREIMTEWGQIEDLLEVMWETFCKRDWKIDEDFLTDYADYSDGADGGDDEDGDEDDEDEDEDEDQGMTDSSGSENSNLHVDNSDDEGDRIDDNEGGGDDVRTRAI